MCSRLLSHGHAPVARPFSFLRLPPLSSSLPDLRHEALARCRIQQSQAQLQVIQMRKEIEAACAAGAPRGSIAERVLHGLEHHVAACGLQAIVGSWEEAQRARIGGKDCVKTPALGRNPNLCFSRMARVFEGHNSGATILRVSPSSRPSNIKGWVSQTTNVSTLKYSALTAQVKSFSGGCALKV